MKQFFAQLALAALLLLPLWSGTGVSGAAAQASGQKAVLITGSSTGIGRKTTEYLAAKGYFVYAGVLHESEMKALNAIKNVQAVKLDVTSPTEIAAAVQTISRAGRGLYGLINNAGVASFTTVADTKRKEFDLMMAVNVAGPFFVTQAFAPLIIRQKGRIVTIGSISGINAGASGSAYSMTKHAIEAFGDSLAAEMKPLGVGVSLIEPGGFRSEIFESGAKRVGQDPSRIDTSKLTEPDDVAKAAEHALFDPNPKLRYMVVAREQEAQITIRKQIAQLVELNEGHRYTYDKQTLVKMLEEALAHSRPRTE